MATKKGGKCKRSNYQAQIASNIGTCAFCKRAVDDEIIYGKLYAIGDIQCHYFCALLSCCLIQKGSDEEGLFGFLYPDIIAEVERCKKHKCSYCYREGANLGCSVTQCRKQFHLPCGRERNAVSLFYGNYKSFCANHAPKQKISDAVAANVKIRIAEERRLKQLKGSQIKNDHSVSANGEARLLTETVCVICYEPVQGYPSTQTFWPPCCARDAWFHRSCLQRMALSAGMHYLKCPLCNDKVNFYKAVIDQGYYVPDRDAAWELEQNAFAEIYERPAVCCAVTCRCEHGRDHHTESGLWDMKLCILCGSTAIHSGCRPSEEDNIYICRICQPAAPADLDTLITSIESVQLQEQSPSRETVRHGPIMPSRMSLRRTKGRLAINTGPSSSRQLTQPQHVTRTEDNQTPSTTDSSRLELNLKRPKRIILDSTARSIDNVLLSPIKMIEQGLSEKMALLNKELSVDSATVLEKLKEKFRKPRPLIEKRRIVNNILEELFSNLLKEPKVKEPVMEWNSPKKTRDVTGDDSKGPVEELSTPLTPTKDNNDIKNDDSPNKTGRKIILQCNTNLNVRKTDREDFKCSFKHKHLETCAVNESKLRTAIDFAIDALKYNENNLKRKIETNIDHIIDSKRRKVNIDDRSVEEKSLNEVIENLKVEKELNTVSNLKDNVDLNVECQDGGQEKEMDTSLNDKVLETTKSYMDVMQIAVESNEEELKTETGRTEKEAIDKVRKRRKMYNISLKRKCAKKSSKDADLLNETVEGNEDKELKTETGVTEKETVDKTDTGVTEKETVDKTDTGVTEKETVDKTDTGVTEKEPVDKVIRKRRKMYNIGLKRKCAKKSRNKDERDETNAIQSVDNLETKSTEKVLKKCADLNSEQVTKTYDRRKKYNTSLRRKSLRNSVKRVNNSKTNIANTKINNNGIVDSNLNKENKIDSKEHFKSENPNLEISKDTKLSNDSVDSKTLKKESKVGSKKQSKSKNSNSKSSKDTNESNTKLDLDIDEKRKVLKLKYKKSHKKKLSLRDTNFKVKIKWKERQLKLKITEKNKLRQPKTPSKVLTQYVLKYSPELVSPNKVIAKPEIDVTPVKRKCIKTEKQCDNLVQTNISRFFKATPRTKE